MRRFFTLLSASLLLACQTNPAPKKDPPLTPLTPTKKIPETKAAPAAVIAPASASAPASMVASAPASVATSWLETPMPVRDPDEPDMMDHATELGWSKDSTEFMYCTPNAAITAGETCIFQDALTGKQKVITTTDKKNEEKTSPVFERELKDRKAKMSYAASTTALVGALISWKEIAGSFDDENPKAKLSVMVHSLDKKKEASVANLELRGVSIHPEAIQVSPDGKYLAIVAHSYMGEYSDEFEITIAPIENLLKLIK